MRHAVVLHFDSTALYYNQSLTKVQQISVETMDQYP